MSYYRKIRLKKELDPKFRSFLRVDNKKKLESDLEKYRQVLLATCVTLQHDPEHTNLYKMYDQVYRALWTYATYLAEDWKIRLVRTLEQNRNELELCGWEYRDRGSDLCSWESLDEVCNHYMEQLFVDALEPTGSMFEPESHYWDKWKAVRDILEDLPDTVEVLMNREFLDTYGDHPDLADESDGYERKFPEELEQEKPDPEEVLDEEEKKVD